MAMEERQKAIKEGAGLEESRLNTEFIEMMKKWGPHLITVVAILAGLWAARDWWNRRAEARADTAFASLEQAIPRDGAPANPAVLERIAEEHPTGTAVPLEARSMAASIHLEAARTGIPIGEKLNADNTIPAGKSFLTAEEKRGELAKAETLFNAVVAGANSSLGQTQIAIGALTGLASIAEDRAEFDKARAFYQQASEKAAGKKLDQLKDIIKNRLDSLDQLKNPPRLYARSELPGGGATPIVAPIGGVTARTSTGEIIKLGDSKPGTVEIPGGGTLVPVSPPVITDSSGTRPATPEEVKKAQKPAETPAPTAPKPAAP